MRHRRTKDGHDGIADELLDRPAVVLDLLLDARVVGRLQTSDVFGIQGLGSSGEPDQVGEEDADDLPLLSTGRL
jgi:hypothetical protein